MPKLKGHKGVKKRVTVSKHGKITRKKGGAGHLMAEKSGKRKRQLRKKSSLSTAFEKKMRGMLH